MKLLAGGNEIIFTELTVRESLFEYSAFVEFSVFTPTPVSEYTLEFQNMSCDLVPVKSEIRETGLFRITCYPKSYVEFLNQVTVPLEDTCDLTKILDSLAVADHFEKHKTQETHWFLPSFRGKSLIDKLTQLVQAESGGCPTFHFTLDGKLWFSDVISECYEQPASAFSGTLSRSVSAITFINEAAGKVNFVFYDEDTITQHTSTFLEGAGQVTVYKLLSNPENKTHEITKAQSVFWRRYVKNSVMNVTKASTYSTTVGVKIKEIGSEADYILIGYTVKTIGQSADVSLEVFPCIKPNQVL